MKSVTLCRNDGLSIDVNQGIGLIGEAIVGKIRKLKVISIISDNFKLKFDLSVDPEFGIIQVKTRRLITDKWQVSFENFNFDHIILICIDGKNIERIYVFPKKEMIKRRCIAIYKNPSRSTWYDNSKNGYRLDEKLYKESYQSIMSFLGDKKHFGAEDIKKWMSL